MLREYKERSETYLNNYNQIENLYLKSDSTASAQLKLTKDEFEVRYKKLADSLKIKSSRIKEITKIKFKTETDTFINWIDSILPTDTIYVGKKINLIEDCFKLKIFEPKDSNFVRIESDLNMEAYMVVHLGKRINRFKIFGLPIFRYGKRSLETDAYLNCKKGKIKIENIKVVD
jgi:hypothetical protein